MISKKITLQLNEQVNHEFFSAYFYLSMSTWFTSKNLNGFANWFGIQAKEELDHALLTINYLNRVGVKVDYLPIEAPKVNFESPLDICKKTLAHEQFVTSMIYKLMDTAQEERDYKTIHFLQWFVNEQVEEEENANDLIQRLKAAGNSEVGILFMDKELATRVYTPISTASAT